MLLMYALRIAGSSVPNLGIAATEQHERIDSNHDHKLLKLAHTPNSVNVVAEDFHHARRLGVYLLDALGPD